jgi:hypothetical protein
MSMPGETVFDPFAGIMTVPYRAIKLGRKAVTPSNSTQQYFLDAAAYCKAAEDQIAVPSLFDMVNDESDEDGSLKMAPHGEASITPKRGRKAKQKVVNAVDLFCGAGGTSPA